MRSAQSRGITRGKVATFLMLAALILSAIAVQVGTAANSGKIIVLGESLSADDRSEMLNYFNAQPEDQIITITVAETNQAMSGVLNALGSYDGVYSSTALTCLDLGDGLFVTTRAITPVTPSMYAMALVTAGIGDAQLVVSGPQNSSAYGTSAMAGVMKTLEIAPCDSGSTTKARRQLAIEQLALTVQIGQALGTTTTGNPNDGIKPAADIILETQKTIVTEKLTKKSDIDKALSAQEKVAGVAFPSELRGQLIDLYVRLVKAKIDWSTFSAGWEISYDGSSQLTMKGDGIAVRNARLTATAGAGGALTATADALSGQAAQTATAEAESAAQTATAAARRDRGTATAQARSAKLTATAEAESARQTATAAARATRDASDAMTATAAAQPTSTVVPTPSPTPEPVGLSGSIDAINGDQLSLNVSGKESPTQLTVDSDAKITRDGKDAALSDVKVGDDADLTIDGSSGHVRVLAASTPPVSIMSRISGFWWILPIGVMIPLVLKVKNRTVVEPFVIKRVTTN